MILKFKRLTEVEPAQIVSLNNNPDVLRQMPLGSANFDLAKANEWARQKDAQWQQYGYGPWAFEIDLISNLLAGVACSTRKVMPTSLWYLTPNFGEVVKLSIKR